MNSREVNTELHVLEILMAGVGILLIGEVGAVPDIVLLIAGIALLATPIAGSMMRWWAG